MKILPTLERGLSIEPESDRDWSVLGMISADIGRPAHLAESFAGLMADDSEWDEWVVPDLVDGFTFQSLLVDAAIADARKQTPPAIIIRPEHADCWYGAVNQARLALQARYRLDVMESLDEVPEDVIEAYIRDRFYSSLQSLLLEFVMDVEDS